jgi:protein phosphatase
MPPHKPTGRDGRDVGNAAAAVRASADQRGQRGPFDIIGDVHGCADELGALLAALGYDIHWGIRSGTRAVRVSPPKGRRAVFVGDLVDRGPNSADVLRLVMATCNDGTALAVPGNHDIKFLRWLSGKQVRISHGLDKTIAEVTAESDAFRRSVMAFFDRLPFHLWLDGGRLAVAHAGIKEKMLGKASGEIRSFCLYGETSGETDNFGLPVRYHWAADYRGETSIVYGHTPVPDAEWVNNTLCVDTGCCFGGKLTALRWPEREIVSVPARAVYSVIPRYGPARHDAA